jgi:heptosyltransferase-2
MFNGKKILMVAPERLGDTLMCTPAMHYLKHHCPYAQIYVIALSALSADVLKNNPALQDVFILPKFKTLLTSQHRYDFALNIHDGELARKYLEVLNLPAEHIPPVDPHIHQAEQALQFVQKLLPGQPEIPDKRYRIFPSPADKVYIDTLFKSYAVDLKKNILIGIQPGCHSLAKKRFAFLRKMTHPKIWPFEHIVELAQKLYRHNPDIKIVITGSKNEEKLGKILSRLLPNIINLINKTTVAQLYVLMKYLSVFISPDTGLMHVACSAEVPLIALFGPTQLIRTGPYPYTSHISVIQESAMADISVDAVFNTLMQKMSGQR